MRRQPLPPTIVAAITVILLFGMVWILSAWDLTFVGSFIAAGVVAGAVGCGMYMFKSSEELGDKGSRLVELVQRSNDYRGGIRDEKTGLLNRWYLEQRLNEEGARCLRYGYSMAVIVLKVSSLDLPRFSMDGWQDEQTIATKRAARLIRNVDLSAVLSPFEYALCFVHCDRTGAEAAIERISTEFWEYDCHVGISLCPMDKCEPSALIDLARARSRPVSSKPLDLKQTGKAADSA